MNKKSYNTTPSDSEEDQEYLDIDSTDGDDDEGQMSNLLFLTLLLN
jgi:hypothetical protein